jgi:hypothetical protein
MKDRFSNLDDLDERGVLRPWLLTILLATAGLTLWTLNEKLDGGPPNTATVIAGDRNSR